MGLEINNQPDLFCFAKNNIIIAGKVNSNDAIITAADAASYTYFMLNTDGGLIDGQWFQIEFSNFNNSGLTKTIKFNVKDIPVNNFDIKSFTAYNRSLKDWVSLFIESILKIPYISDNYNFAINSAFNDRIGFTIGAKQKGTEWNFIATINYPHFFPGNQSAVISQGIDLLDNIYVQCHLYKKSFQTGAGNDLFILDKICTYKAFLNSDKKFSFSINTDILKYLQTYLYKNGDFLHLGTQIFRYIIELKNRNNHLNDSGNISDPGEDLLFQDDFTAIKGGRSFYESIGKDINLDYYQNENRIFLTKRPKIIYVGSDIIINDILINNDTVISNHLFSTVEFTYENGVTEIMDIPNVIKLNNKMCCIVFNFNDQFFADQFQQKYPVSLKYYVKNLDSNNNNIEELTGIFSETREIIFNRKPFRTENYFRFYGSLGNSEFCWFNGKIEAEVEADGIDYEKDLSHVNTMYGDEETIWKEFQNGKDEVNYNQKFKINTGYKTKEEIQWLQELIGSELIFWYTKDQLKALINSVNGIDFLQEDLYYQVVTINKNSIQYFDSENDLQAMTFEFKIAVESAAPHYVIKDNLIAEKIDKGIFVFDVTQAQLYRADFNPKLILKVKPGYQLGSQLIINHWSLDEPIVSTILDENDITVGNNPDSNDLAYTTNLEEMAAQIKLVIDKFSSEQFNITIGSDYLEFTNRDLFLKDVVTFEITATFVEKQFLNCNNIWKYILNNSPVAKIEGFTFANNSDKIYLHEILQNNENGVETFYNFKFPNDLESWIYCIAEYFMTNPQLSLFETVIDNRGLIKIKYKTGGGLASSNALLVGLMDKYIYVTKLQD